LLFHPLKPLTGAVPGGFDAKLNTVVVCPFQNCPAILQAHSVYSESQLESDINQ